MRIAVVLWECILLEDCAFFKNVFHVSRRRVTMHAWHAQLHNTSKPSLHDIRDTHSMLLLRRAYGTLEARSIADVLNTAGATAV